MFPPSLVRCRVPSTPLSELTNKGQLIYERLKGPEFEGRLSLNEFVDLLYYMSHKFKIDFEILIKACFLYEKSEDFNFSGAEKQLLKYLSRIGSKGFDVNQTLKYLLFENEKPLHLAAKEGCSVLCSALIKAGSDIESLDIRNKTPLQAACHFGKLECVKKLVELGANMMKCVDPQSPPIVEGVRFPEIIQFLYDNYDPKQSSYLHQFQGFLDIALREAVEESYYQSVKKLLKLTSSPPNYKKLRKLAVFNIMQKAWEGCWHDFFRVDILDKLHLPLESSASISEKIACVRKRYIEREDSSFAYQIVPLRSSIKKIVKCINILSLLNHYQYQHRMNEICIFKSKAIISLKRCEKQEFFLNLKAISEVIFIALNRGEGSSIIKWEKVSREELGELTDRLVDACSTVAESYKP